MPPNQLRIVLDRHRYDLRHLFQGTQEGVEVPSKRCSKVIELFKAMQKEMGLCQAIESGNSKAEKLFQRLVRKYGKGKALSVLASKLARAVYYILKRERIFDMKKFLTN